MENPCPLILEISSDEEAGFDDSRKGGGAGFGDGEDCDWLSKLLCEVGGNVDDDSDDVVFVTEVFPKAPKKLRSESLKPSLKIVSDEGDDDDCVVLDCDPDKPVVLVNSRAEDNDDIEIVGEKGEIACRDFPHPRHLCVKFPFMSTSHEFHCSQCHCYVCDSLAPCSHWSTGAGSIDHCHASDKEEYWIAERKRVKKADKPVSMVLTTGGSSPLDAYFPPIQVPALAQPQVNSLVISQGINPVTIHPPAMPSNVSVPNAFNRARSHTPGYMITRYKTRSELVSPSSLSTRNNNVASRELTHRLGSRNPQFFSSHTVFNNHGLVGSSPNSRHSFKNQLIRDPSLKRCRAFQTPIVNGHQVSNQKNVGVRAADSVITQPKMSSPHSLNSRHPNCLRSQSRLHSRPYSSCLKNRDRVQYQSQTPPQVCMNRNFQSTGPLQSNISSQPSGENINNLSLPQSPVFQHNNPAPSQTVASYQSDGGNNFGNQLHLRSVISSHPNPSVGNNLENHSSQLQGHENPASLLMNDKNNVQQGSYSQDGVDASPTDFSFYQNSSLNNENLQILAEESQYQGTEPSETSLLHNIPKIDHHTSVGPVDTIPRQNAVQADYISTIYDTDCQFPETTGPDPLDFQFDSWMFDNQSLSGALGEPAPSDWNVFSPEPAFIDPGNLFDI